MHISRTNLDTLNAVVNISVAKEDYAKKVASVLDNYRKKATVPGFRKGQVSMSLVKKQYEKTVIAEEVNKLLQENLGQYLQQEQLDILGNPLPKASEGPLDWNADTLDFAFELGLVPQFEVNLKVLKGVTHYQIESDAKMIGEQMAYFQKQFGKLVSQKHPQKGFEITAQFKNEAAELDVLGTFTLEDLKSKKAKATLLASTAGDRLELSCKDLFSEAIKTKRILQIDDEKFNNLSGDLQVEIKEINERVLAELNQELFDKLYESGTVTSEVAFKEKIAEGFQKQFQPQSDQKLLDDILECMVAKTKFKLPEAFLKKWMQQTGEEPLTEAAAVEQFTKSEKGIRYQLIESKLVKEYGLGITPDALKDYAKGLLQKQMAQYGHVPEDKELEDTTMRVLSNRDEARRLSDQLMSQKLLNFFKENAPFKTKKVSFDAFVKEAYPKD